MAMDNKFTFDVEIELPLKFRLKSIWRFVVERKAPAAALTLGLFEN
jgi:hypothetical protein